MFKTIQAKNLFSWADLDYNIPEGVSQITGHNFDDETPEGSGKSAVLNVMSWTLFAKIPKEAKIDEVVRHGQKHGLGRVILDDATEVVRSRKPNDVFIRRNGEDLRGKDAKETQAMIIKLIGMDFDCFCQTIYFAQNYPKKFISANEADKAKILSDIQDLSIFDKAREASKKRTKVAEAALHQSDLDISNTNGALQSLAGQQKLLTEFVNGFELDKATKLKELNVELDEIGRKAVSYEEVMGTQEDEKALKEAHDQATEMQRALALTRAEQMAEIRAHAANVKSAELHATKLTRNKSRLDNLNAKLEQFQAPDTCPTCKGAITEEVSNSIFQEKASMESELQELLKEQGFLVASATSTDLKSMEELDASLAEVNTEMGKVESDLRMFQKELQDTVDIQREYVSLCERLMEVSAQIKEVEGSAPTRQLDQLNDVESKMALAQSDLERQRQEQGAMTTSVNRLNVLKDGFKEVKSYIYQEFLKTLSSESTALAQELFEVPIQITFTNESEGGGVAKILTEITLDGVPRSLGLYSGGQYRRIQLAVDLALAKIIGQRSQNPINLRILDEPFKDLSLTSMEKVVELISRLGGKTVIIEHNPVVKSIINSTFHVEYRNGVSHAT